MGLREGRSQGWHLPTWGCLLWRGELTWEAELEGVWLFRVSLLKPWPEQTAWPPWGLLINADAQVPTQPTTIKFKRLSLIQCLMSCQCWSLCLSYASFFTQFNLSGTTGILSPSAPKFVNGVPWVSGVCEDWMCMQTLICMDSFLGKGPTAR